MALDAKEIAINASADAYNAALNDYLDGLNAGTVVRFLLPKLGQSSRAAGASPDAPVYPANAAKADMDIIHYIVPKSTSNDSVWWVMHGWNRGFLPIASLKVTNAAGEVASA